MLHVPLPPHPRHRAALWLNACKHRAVLPWVQKCLHLARAAEDDKEYRHLLKVHARLEHQLESLDATLRALDPAWADRVLVIFYAQHPDGTPDWAQRLH